MCSIQWMASAYKRLNNRISCNGFVLVWHTHTQHTHKYIYIYTYIFWDQVGLLLTHWGRVTHMCVSNLSSIGSDNGLSPGRRQAIIWTNAKLLSVGTLRTYFKELQSKYSNLNWGKCTWNVVYEMASILSRPRCVNAVVLPSPSHQLPLAL